MHTLAWYWVEVKGNLLATPIIAVIVGLYVRFRHTVAEEAHRELMRQHADHAKDLVRLIDALDPSTDGGIAEIRKQLDALTDSVDPEIETGLTMWIHTLLSKGSK